MRRFLSILLCLIFLQTHLFAQEKLTVRPIGRILVDAGIFETNEIGLNNGVSIPDFRAGAYAEIGKFSAYIDVSYARAKVHIKDICIEGKFDPKNTFSLGYFYHQFGYQGSFGSSRKITMLEPAIDGIFVGGRQIGLMWVHNNHDFWGTLSLVVEEDAMKKTTEELGNPGYGATSRMVYRPIREKGQVFHVGFSWAYDTPKFNEDPELNHRSYTLEGCYPTYLSSITMLHGVIPEAKNRWRFTPELCAAYGKIGLEAQYYYMTIQREQNLPAYQTSGAYAQVRGLLKGTHYAYNEAYSLISPAEFGAWECVLAYNYVDLDSQKCNVYGGKMQDLSLTFNHYLNKYITWRLRYSFTKVKNQKHDLSINALQTRLQFHF